LASLAAPAVGTCTQAAITTGSSLVANGNYGTYNMTPGVYPVNRSTCYGINLSGNFTTLNFASGTYGNSVSLTGNITNANFSPGQYQNGGGNGKSVYINGNTNTATFAAGSYTFCGPVALVGNNPSITLRPGLYYGGISITGNAHVKFQAGTYILAGGGLSVTGNATITGTGVTFYDATGLGGYQPINITGNAQLNLSAPTSGPLKGILFFQDRSIASGSAGSTIVGNSSSSFDGAHYLAEIRGQLECLGLHADSCGYRPNHWQRHCWRQLHVAQQRFAGCVKCALPITAISDPAGAHRARVGLRSTARAWSSLL
jgi:hypothetical protein